MSSRGNEKKERHLSLNEVQYFERAMDAFSEIKSYQEAADFFQPIDDELRGKEVLIAEHKVCSRFLDEYIKQCPDESLLRLFRAFSSHFEELSYDKFGSHAVENLINEVIQRLDAGSNEEARFNELLASLVTELTPSSPMLSENPSSTHVIRCIISKLSQFQNLVSKIDKLSRAIIRSFLEDPSKVQTIYFSATVQCIASLDPEKYKKLLNYLIASVQCQFENLSDKINSKLIESLIINLGHPATTAVFQQTLGGDVKRAVDCAFDKFANYVLQRWLEYCRDPEQLISVINQLLPKIEQLISRRPQVVVSISKGLILTNHKLQDSFMKKLNEQTNGTNFVEYFSHFNPPNGTKLLQNLCYFNSKAIQATLIDSMVKMEGEIIYLISIDVGGSYFINDFLKSESIDIKLRKKIIRRIVKQMGQLAIDRNGRYVVESSFNLADIQLKKEICSNIKETCQGQQIEGMSVQKYKENAKTVWKNLRMEQFISNVDMWTKDTNLIMKRQEAMNEIINDESIPDVKPVKPKKYDAENEIAEMVQDPEMAEFAQSLEEGSQQKKRRRKHHHTEETENQE